MMLLLCILLVCILNAHGLRGWVTRPLMRLSAVVSEVGAIDQNFVAQKNFILLDKLENPTGGELSAAAMQYVNFCDESFNNFLNERIESSETEERRERLGRVRYEINSARQKKLIEADKILRGVLSSGGLKEMEAKLAYHLRRAEIDMAFMVILQLNIEDAMNNNVEKAVQIMTHLETLINEHQDKIVSPPVRLMRMLLRAQDSNVRKQMLRQKLMIGDYQMSSAQAEAAADVLEVEQKAGNAAAAAALADGPAQPTMSPQCEHIVVAAVQTWGAADVSVDQLRDTVGDVMQQMSSTGGDPGTLREMEGKCATLIRELQEVIDELARPRNSDDLCDDGKEKLAAAAAAAKLVGGK